MKDRYNKIGIKQVIRLEWMDKTAELLIEGHPVNEIRNILNEYLSSRKQSGGFGDRGEKTYGMALNILSSWFSPDKELENFRDYVLGIAKKTNKENWLPLHWAIISASYPFWFNLAVHVGRLLNLQDNISQKQIFNRVKEQYGDRETVARNARYNVRSLIAWQVLKDTDQKGIYAKGKTNRLENIDLYLPLIEAYILAYPEKAFNLNDILNSPGFFPFDMAKITPDQIISASKRIDIVNTSADGKYIALNY